jgi:hypothetical protein
MTEENKNNSTPTPGAYSSGLLDAAIDRVKAWKAAKDRAKLPMSDNFVINALNSTIKRDDTNKQITFYAMGLNYTFEDQQNLMYSAPSATGKSYIALEIAKYFPKEDVDSKGYTSKRAFFHQNSKLEAADGSELPDVKAYVDEKLKLWEEKHEKPPARTFNKKKEDVRNPAFVEWKGARKAEYGRLRDEWDAIDKLYVVDLEKRILIFKDMPDDQVMEPLRSLLSHDERDLIADITDKNSSGQNRTKRVKLHGFPTTVFIQANFSTDEQEKTRVFMLSPDMDQDKIKESLDLQAENLRDRDSFNTKIEAEEGRLALKARIELVKAMNIQQIVLKREDMESLKNRFISGIDGTQRALMPRDMRDFPRIVALAKGHALFNLPDRVHEPNGNLEATIEDIEAAEKIFEPIIMANRLGLPPYVYDWYQATLKGLLEAVGDEGLTKIEFNQCYYTRFKSRLSDKARKRLISTLEEAGFLEERTNPGDKRTTKLYATWVGVENKIISDDPKTGGA